MTEKLNKTIKEELVKLPTEMQNAISSLDWGSVSKEIGKKYLLDESEINNLQVETGLVLIGVVNEDLYASNIENEVGTSKNEAEKIANEINQKIFDPIYETVTKTIEENLKNKKVDWKQTVSFIISGGNYFVFMEKNNDLNTSKEFLKTNILNKD